MAIRQKIKGVFGWNFGLGRDHSADGSYLISHLISIAVESIGLERIHRLVPKGRLDAPALGRALERMEKIEQSHNPILAAYQFEAENQAAMLTRIQEQPELLSQGMQKQESLWDLVLEGRFTWDLYKEMAAERAKVRRLAANPEKAAADQEKLAAIFLEGARTDWWRPERVQLEEDFQTNLENAHPLIKMWQPTYNEATVRYLAAVSKIRQARLAAAIEAEKLDQARYPRTLDPVVNRYFDGTAPVDPFSGKPFQYQPAADATQYRLWGAGPQMENLLGAVAYDSTNGTTSRGDLFFIPPSP